MSTVSRTYFTSARVLGKFIGSKKQRPVTTSKEMPRGWYKGKGGRRVGRHTRKGKFMVDSNLVPQFPMVFEQQQQAAADADDAAVDVLPLRPYVSKNTPKVLVPPPSFELLKQALIERNKASMP